MIKENVRHLFSGEWCIIGDLSYGLRVHEDSDFRNWQVDDEA